MAENVRLKKNPGFVQFMVENPQTKPASLSLIYGISVAARSEFSR